MSRCHKDDCCCEKKCFVKKCWWEPYDPCCLNTCNTSTCGSGTGCESWLGIIIFIAIIWWLCGNGKDKC